MVKFTKPRQKRQGNRLHSFTHPHKAILSAATRLMRHERRSEAEDSTIQLGLVPETTAVEHSFAVSGSIKSPESNDSTPSGSATGSQVASSTPRSGSTCLLARKRKLAPTLETTTSSVRSGADLHIPSSLEIYDDTRRKRRGSLSQRSDYADSRRRLPALAAKLTIGVPGPSMDETLMHIGHQNNQLSPKHHEPMHLARPGSAQRRRIPGVPNTANRNAPWNEHSLLHDNHAQINPAIASETRKGGRPLGRQLTEEEAEHAAQRRRDRACLKCHINRVKCVPVDGGRSCRTCNVRERNWLLGCTKLRLEDCIDYFIPNVYKDDVNQEQFNAFMGRNSVTYSGPQFELALTQKIGGPRQKLLYVNVREVDPIGNSLHQRFLHLVVDGRVESVDVDSPPIYPFYPDDLDDSQEVLAHIKLWIKDIEENQGANWHWYCFLEEQEPLWQRDIMEEICKYYHESDFDDDRLKNAMSLTIFLYITIHPFRVPEEKVPDLYKRLQHPLFKEKMPDKPVSPRAVNKFIAMLLLPKLTEVAHKALKDLAALLRLRTCDTSRTTRELTFCIAFLCLMVVAHFQNLVLQYNLGDEVLGEKSISREDAVKQIMKMENELGGLIIELSRVQLRKTRPKARPVEPGSLFERLRSITERCGERFNDSRKYKLQLIDETMVASNVGRLLCKFYMAVQRWIE